VSAPTPAGDEGVGGRSRCAVKLRRGPYNCRGGEVLEPGKEMIFSFLNNLDMWAIDVIGMVENVELYQSFCEILDPRWICNFGVVCLEPELRQTRPKLYRNQRVLKDQIEL
jgi:hypothetical protein